MISWKDSILAFGGSYDYNIVQKFNTTLNSWSVLNAGTAPIELKRAKCILLPNNQVLRVGPLYDKKSSALFDIQTHTWEKLADSMHDLYFSSLVNLNGNVFMFGVKENVVEEFHHENKTWTEIEARTINWHKYTSALALPAEIFAHLPGGCKGIN
jgi:hypothetical protein